MMYVAASTMPVNDIPYAPAGTIAYIEPEVGSPSNVISRIQSMVADRARHAGAKVVCKSRILMSPKGTDIAGQWIVRVEVVEPGSRKS